MVPLLLAAVVVTGWGLSRCPYATLLLIAALGGAHANGLTVLPDALTAPAARASGQLRDWQDTRAAKLSCQQRAVAATASADELRIAHAEAACASAWTP